MTPANTTNTHANCLKNLLRISKNILEHKFQFQYREIKYLEWDKANGPIYNSKRRDWKICPSEPRWTRFQFLTTYLRERVEVTVKHVILWIFQHPVTPKIDINQFRSVPQLWLLSFNMSLSFNIFLRLLAAIVWARKLYLTSLFYFTGWKSIRHGVVRKRI